MASRNHLLPLILPLLPTLFVGVLAFDASINSPFYPLNCSEQVQTCNATLYHISHNLTVDQIASYYSVDSTQICPIIRGNNQDYLITVPCSCKNNRELSGYFYDTTYKVKRNDTFFDISEQIYSGQAWPDQHTLQPDQKLRIHLVCGCTESNSEIVVTYTVQTNDTVSAIANLLSSELSEMQSLNEVLRRNPSFVDVGWVLFVPMHKNANP